WTQCARLISARSARSYNSSSVSSLRGLERENTRQKIPEIGERGSVIRECMQSHTDRTQLFRGGFAARDAAFQKLDLAVVIGSVFGDVEPLAVRRHRVSEIPPE